jgi:uncharacterized protein YqgV (UPF0045/DUF77 family)
MSGITAQVSLYPLRQDDLSPSIDAVTKALARHGIERETGAMSTLVWGDDEKVFPALIDAFRDPGRMEETEPVREGYGEGCFVVVKADKSF